MSDTLEWLSKVKASKKNVVSFEEEGDDGEDSFQGKMSSIVPNLPKRATKTYSGKDLSGLKVAHDYDSFEAGKSEILVLDDSSVLQAETSGDLLVSANLREEARIKRHRDIARHVKGYSGFKAYEEDTTNDEPITLGGQIKKSNVLQKYDYLEGFDNLPEAGKGFIIGEVNGGEFARKVVKVEQNHAAVADTVRTAGTELIDFSKRKIATDLERERKRAKKLTKTLFADEPEMQIDPAEEERAPAMVAEDDDSDLQRIIATSRKSHLNINPMAVDPVYKPLSIKGKSFDAIFTDSIIATSIEKTQETKHQREEVTMESTRSDSQEELEPVLAEPLVRNGVAATLSLLCMRGISLKPRVYEEDFKSKNQIGADIKLEYFDDFGNTLTSKEAYKELSRRFHGKKAGKARIEKAIMKREQTNRTEKANASESVIVANLRKQQAEAGTPYVLLSSARAMDAASEQQSVSNAEPVKQRKIFGLQVKK